ncbi:MAG: GntR family transcriptional regulator [Capsulimonadaceae bacterium]|nr:GntR family transcriptional regulator [Capsulimonadaceae bacterium]
MSLTTEPTKRKPVKRAKQPAYQRIEHDLRRRIANDEWLPGVLLPGRRALADHYGVTIPTLELAIGALIEDGVVRAEQGRGTFVATGRTSDQPALAPQSDAFPKPIDRTSSATSTVGIVAFDWTSSPAPSSRANTNNDFSAAWAATIMAGFEEGLSGFGMHSQLFNTYSPVGDSYRRIPLDQAIDHLLQVQVSGLVFVLYDVSTVMSALRASNATDIPSVIIGDRDPRFTVPTVYFDQRNSGNRAATHLLECGCSRLLFFGPTETTYSRERLLGVRDAIETNGLSANSLDAALFSDDAHPHTSATARPTLVAVSDAFGHGGEIVGVIGANDDCAIYFMEYASELGMKPGVDYKLIGFDDLPASRQFGLTTLRPPLVTMGNRACALLRQAMAGDHSDQSICVRAHLVKRSSTGSGKHW